MKFAPERRSRVRSWSEACRKIILPHRRAGSALRAWIPARRLCRAAAVTARYVSVTDMKIEIEISDVLQFRLVLHTLFTVPSTATSSRSHHVLENEEMFDALGRFIPIVGRR